MPIHPSLTLCHPLILRIQFETPPPLHAAIPNVMIAALSLAEHQRAFEALQYHVVEIGSGNEDEDVDDIFANEFRDRGAADVGDGEGVEICEGEVVEKVGFYGFEGLRVGGVVVVDLDLHGCSSGELGCA